MPKLQPTIYKLDINKMNLPNNKNKLITKIKNVLCETEKFSREIIFSTISNDNKTLLIVFHDSKPVDWKEFMPKQKNEIGFDTFPERELLENKTHSWLIIHNPRNNHVYAHAGGLGRTLISKYVELNFGRNLSTKIFTGNEEMLRKKNSNDISPNNIDTTSETYSEVEVLSSGTSYDKIVNGMETNIKLQKLNKILRTSLPGVAKKQINLDIKDAFKIQHNVSFQDLITIIDKIYWIDVHEESKFYYDAYISLRKSGKTGITQTYMNNVMVKQIIKDLESNVNSLSVIEVSENNDSSENSIWKSEKIIIKDEKGNLIKEFQIGHYDDLFYNSLKLVAKVTKKSINNMLFNNIIEFIDNNGQVVEDFKGIATLFRVSLIKEKAEYIMLKNTWYTFNKSFVDDAKNKIKDACQGVWKLDSLRNFNYKTGSAKNEKDYNDSFRCPSTESLSKVLHADTLKIKGIEIADLIYVEENGKDMKIYLFCNKNKWEGNSVLKLMNQIKNSKDMLDKLTKNDPNNELDKYIERLYKNNTCKKSVDKDSLKELLKNRAIPIIFVANFIQEIKIDFDSSIAFLELKKIKDDFDMLQHSRYAFKLTDIMI